MAYFEDLSEYSYLDSYFYRPRTKNIGWLDATHEVPKSAPTDDELDLVWAYCKTSIAQTRGVHDCEMCPVATSYYVKRNDEPLLLGTSEIRVFGTDGTIYAAPTLIYHYISVHHYKPPDEFLLALREGPRPPSEEYFDRLRELDLEWRPTSAPATKPFRSGDVQSPGGGWKREIVG
jgi:hypothetical protein